jgi:ATP-dependent phosphoenolpyruvate carboxykinase
VQDTFVGADPKYRLPIRVINELAWHSLFARTMFISNTAKLSHTTRIHDHQLPELSRPIHNATARDRQRSS